MEINNKIGVITGGTGGIGISIVENLLKSGIRFIALFELDDSNSKKVYDTLKKKYGNKVGFYSCDVTDKKQFSENLDKVFETYKTVDILINNAGLIDECKFELMIDVNYKAVVSGSLMFIERVGKHNDGKGGTIVNTASILGLTNRKLPIYCSTKHAVVSFTRIMDEQFDVTGVRVMAICPGVTVTPLLNNVSNGLNFINYDGALTVFPSQSPDNVGSAVIKIIETGKSGDVWVSEENEPPYLTKDVVHDHKILRVD